MNISEMIEGCSISLVREYLYRKGLKTTLNTLDTECPRNYLSINSSSELAKKLKIENFIKRNKLKETPYSSILEVIVHQIKIGRHAIENQKLKVHRHKPLTLLALSDLKSLHNKLNEKGENVDFLTLIKLYCGCSTKKYCERRSYSCLNLAGHLEKHNDIRRDEKGEPTIEFDERFYYTQREPQSYTQKESSTLTEKENVLKSFVLGDNNFQPTNENEVRLEALDVQQSISNGNSSQDESEGFTRHSPKRELNSERSTSDPPKHGNRWGSLKTNNTDQNAGKNENFLKLSPKKCASDDSQNECISFEMPSYKADITNKVSDEDPMPCEVKGTDMTFKVIENSENLEILENNVIESNTGINNENLHSPRKHQEKCLLKKIILANNQNVSKTWLGERFIFDKKPTSYGLIQQKEECSGLLAAINAYVIKELLFNETKKDVEYLRPNESQLRPALIEAMLQILLQAGETKATLALLENEPTEIKTVEELIDQAIYISFTTKDDLRTSLKDKITQFVNQGSHGCILFLISVIVSRGVENVLEDMNGVTTLINSNGACNLELVNLLISGIAVSNVFDNHIKLQCSTIKGIPKRSEIGYLSIKEHFKCCKVGSYLKTPRFPIWIVHNENQFTILFSCQKQLLSDWKVERKFIMTYYNPLRYSGKEIRLSIDTTLTVDENNARDNMKATVENCMRTKWKDANITWK